MFSEERFCSFSILSRKIHGGGHELSKGIGILRTEERLSPLMFTSKSSESLIRVVTIVNYVIKSSLVTN